VDENAIPIIGKFGKSDTLKSAINNYDDDDSIQARSRKIHVPRKAMKAS